MFLPLLYLPALLIFAWLFLREECDYPWSRIRKVLFAILLCLTQMSLVAGFMGLASFDVNMKARGTGQGYVAAVRDALGEKDFSAQEIVAGIEEKFFPSADPGEWRAIKRTLAVRSVLVIAALLLLVGVLIAAARFKLKTLPFLLLFYGCAACNCVVDFYFGNSVSDLEWYHFRYGRFRDLHQTVGERILSCKDRFVLRLAWEDVCDARIWDSLETDEPLVCDEKCEEFLSALNNSLKKYESNGASKTVNPEE